MAAKIGTGDVSFRLGSTTPAAVYLGSEQVWSAATVPGAPTALGEWNNALIYWTDPADDGGSPITGYKVYVTGGPDLFSSEMYDDTDVTARGVINKPPDPENEAPAGDAEWKMGVDGGIVAGEDLVWQVAAVNAVGEGPKSAPLTATIA